jgi:hypothetical protein
MPKLPDILHFVASYFLAVAMPNSRFMGEKSTRAKVAKHSGIRRVGARKMSGAKIIEEKLN